MLLSNLTCEELVHYAYLEAKTPLEIELRKWLEQALPNMAQLAQISMRVREAPEAYGSNPSMWDFCCELEMILGRYPLAPTETVANLITST